VLTSCGDFRKAATGDDPGAVWEVLMKSLRAPSELSVAQRSTGFSFVVSAFSACEDKRQKSIAT
jgi:hypothetical protein